MPKKFLEILMKNSCEENIHMLMNLQILKREMKCSECDTFMKLESFNVSIDKFAWRCYTKTCKYYKKRINIRTDSIFEGLKLTLSDVFMVLIDWIFEIQQYATLKRVEIHKNTYKKIYDKIIDLIVKKYEMRKLGGVGAIVQVDETMLNYKCKSHRGRSSKNKTDALCMIEYRNGISYAFATVIEDKKASTILPIICENVVNNSEIHTDEHQSYKNLGKLGYKHRSVCHKYEFVNKANGANTQAIESFHNCLKLEIKKRKGIKTENRSIFLKEFIWKYNHRTDRFKHLLDLIKCH